MGPSDTETLDQRVMKEPHNHLLTTPSYRIYYRTGTLTHARCAQHAPSGCGTVLTVNVRRAVPASRPLHVSRHLGYGYRTGVAEK
jgi:hypothetical protein